MTEANKLTMISIVRPKSVHTKQVRSITQHGRHLTGHRHAASSGPFIINRCFFNFAEIFNLHFIFGIYRLTHSANELSGFTCTSSLTMNEKFQYHSKLCRVCIENFEFMVSERVQVNPDIYEQ